MVNSIVVCWIVTHTTMDKNDYRDNKQFRGYAMKEFDDSIEVNFYDEFIKNNINLDFNPVVQIIRDTDCLYVK